ncbi:MAG TPA: alkaline phosphatase [Pirellulales bacterium]|nr:alkaline phosphatase [Pirellulales bacterium]
MLNLPRSLFLGAVCALALAAPAGAQVSRDCADDARDHLRCLQLDAMAKGKAGWAHWGINGNRYSGWTRHSNRLIPCYTFGISLDGFSGRNSVYRDRAKIEALYGRLPEATLNPQAEYFDQTDLYHLQKRAIAAGKKYVVLFVFDGMDWQTTRAAAVYARGDVAYETGRGTGLAFQDYRGVETDFGYFVSSPHNDKTTFDVEAQTVVNPGGTVPGGYDFRRGGSAPWSPPEEPAYLLGELREQKQAVTDSAASATSMTCGIKTYNDAINVDPNGQQSVPLAHDLQAQGFAVGVVTSVPISHATPAAAYANNVTRDDYQDLTRDMLGLPSVAHRAEPLPGVDVLLGAGWGHEGLLPDGQGKDFVPGNRYLTKDDLVRIDVDQGGRYVVAQRTSGSNGRELLQAAAKRAAEEHHRLLGFFGVRTGHLPFRTADGKYNPAPGVAMISEFYSDADVAENPTLADMTRAALEVLATNERGFWLMVEAGDVDWANHDDNLDSSIGAVLSGDDAFQAITQWAERNDCWEQTAVIVTADHGHYLVLDNPAALIENRPEGRGSH